MGGRRSREIKLVLHEDGVGKTKSRLHIESVDSSKLRHENNVSILLRCDFPKFLQTSLVFQHTGSMGQLSSRGGEEGSGTIDVDLMLALLGIEK